MWAAESNASRGAFLPLRDEKSLYDAVLLVTPRRSRLTKTMISLWRCGRKICAHWIQQRHAARALFDANHFGVSCNIRQGERERGRERETQWIFPLQESSVPCVAVREANYSELMQQRCWQTMTGEARRRKGEIEKFPHSRERKREMEIHLLQISSSPNYLLPKLKAAQHIIISFGMSS